MPDNTNNPTTSSTPGAGDNNSGGQRKIAGKYNSTEEAIEAMDRAHTQNLHETREELGVIKELIERSMTTPIGRGNDQGDSGDQGYRRNSQQQHEDEFDVAEFLTDPRKVLNRRDQKIRDEMEERHSRRTAAMIANASAVLRFQSRHSDLDEHEALVQSFLGKTDARKPIGQRLEDAAKETYKYLAKLRGKGGDDGSGNEGPGRTPNNEEFVEDAANNGAGRPNSNPGGDNQTPSADDDLSSEIQERRQFKSARFAAPKK